MLPNIHGIEGSTFYQALLSQGEARGIRRHARECLLRRGGQRFGPPPPPVEAAIDAIEDVARLDRLADKVGQFGSWEELLRSE
jgi:hypothetical protein